MRQQYVRNVRLTRAPLLTASAGLLGLATLDFLLFGTRLGGVPLVLWLALLLAANLLITHRCPAAKVAVVRRIQRDLVNPVVSLALRLRVPLGWCLLETTGRRTGQPRHVPVGDGRVGSDFWIVVEHGRRAGYLHNLRAEPHVRLLLRRGMRLDWVEGVAEVLDEDDPYARQRTFAGWRHPVRACNAMFVRVLGADPVTVRVRLLAWSHEPSVPGNERGLDARLTAELGKHP